ncbi:ArsR family transcriptional regulator [Thermogladius sp. 4427co]|uniref:ArsR family transcriptional regulator n=1 Tax=Thermogladius sp. 4427co TaxID=3450718 RepID=UPI003F7A4676
MSKKLLWRNAPLYRIVVEEVLSRPEGVLESDLIEILKKKYDIEISRAELYQSLIKLELNGFIHVDYVGKEMKIRPSKNFASILGS